MKTNKSIIAFSLFLTLTLLTACKEENPSLEERMASAENIVESFEGVLKPIDTFEYYENGTHQLETSDEGLIVLQSRTIDLNKYINKNVNVQGEMEKPVGKAKPVFSVTRVMILNETEATQKKYDSKAFGFQFEYPSIWLVEEGNQGVTLSSAEEDVVQITVFSDQSDLQTFASSRQTGEAVEVTVASQKSLRYALDDSLSFYVPNPPKEKLYLLKYVPSPQEDREVQQELFYELLKSFKLIYMSDVKGAACGGEPPVECAEGFVCELKSGAEFAEGTCMPVGANINPNSCPYISPPSNCDDYRISDYSSNGCPALYECVIGGSDVDEGLEEISNEDEENMDEDDADEKQDSDSEDTEVEEKTYVVPSVSKVTGEYVSERLGLKFNYPSSWYYASFGAIDGTQGKVGFSNVELEEPDQAIITMSISKQDGGRVSKKIGDLYYVFEGPEDLIEVMEEMAENVEKVEVE